ncbi:MAG TPA: ribosome biogenesis GTP-binding protein YihA/YsxC [Pseudogracilibacillus sp.]|nr:ribosome biogenesis GTP-binding protein YihA/YsxC [Pseudogracilibacillus sp.]
MKINKAEIITSAAKKEQYPRTNLKEIALAGRSNVGKSSFINKIINRRNLVRTSSKPGKTQTLNFYNINDVLCFVDVPGYGYAKVPKTEKEKWARMMEEYFETRENLGLVMLIVDLRHNPTQDDFNMYHYIKHFDIPVIVVATKADKVKKSMKQKNINQIKIKLDIDLNDPVIAFSSETGEGKDLIWRHLTQFIK